MDTTAQTRLLLSEAYDALAIREAAAAERITESQQYLLQADQQMQDLDSRLVAALQGRRSDAEEAAALAEELHSAQARIRELQQQLESARMANVQLELKLADQMAALAGAAGSADTSTQDAPADDVLADIVLQSEAQHTADVQRLMSVEQALGASQAEEEEQRAEAHHSKALLLQLHQEAASRAANEEQLHSSMFSLLQAAEDARVQVAQKTAERMGWSSDVSSASSSSASPLGSSPASDDDTLYSPAPAPEVTSPKAASSAQEGIKSSSSTLAKSVSDDIAGGDKVARYEKELMKRIALRAVPGCLVRQ